MARDTDQVPPLASHWLGGCVAQLPWVWKRMGNLETRMLAERIEHVRIDRPIYVSGLGRAGTTTLLDLLSSHEDVATHQYRDFPLLLTPCWWGEKQAQRPAKSRLFVTRKTTKALEEMLWMAFFPQSHNPMVSQVLERDVQANAFAKFYRDHVRKLLLLRKRRRYLANGNYNLTRIPWLAKQFADGRFVITVRHPVQHVAALMKQHRYVCNLQQRRPRALAHARQLGRFEFGLDRRPINVGNTVELRAMQELWSRPDQAARGWARYWASLYGWVLDRLMRDPLLVDRVLLLKYEDVCRDPYEQTNHLLAHCELDVTRQISTWRKRMTPPEVSPPKFSDDELAAIQEETADVASRLGYAFENEMEFVPDTRQSASTIRAGRRSCQHV